MLGAEARKSIKIWFLPLWKSWSLGRECNLGRDAPIVSRWGEVGSQERGSLLSDRAERFSERVNFHWGLQAYLSVQARFICERLEGGKGLEGKTILGWKQHE